MQRAPIPFQMHACAQSIADKLNSVSVIGAVATYQHLDAHYSASGGILLQVCGNMHKQVGWRMGTGAWGIPSACGCACALCRHALMHADSCRDQPNSNALTHFAPLLFVMRRAWITGLPSHSSWCAWAAAAGQA